MSQDVGNQILDFQYEFMNSDAVTFLDSAFEIGFLPQTVDDCVSKGGLDDYGCYGIKTLFPDDDPKVVSLVADNMAHREFVFYGLQLQLFPSTFLDYLEFGLQDKEFASEDDDTIELLLQGVEQALREAFNQPFTQTEVPHKKNFSQ
jgi:hypothetical protein